MKYLKPISVNAMRCDGEIDLLLLLLKTELSPPPMSKTRTVFVPTTSRPYAIAAAVDSTIK